MNKIISNSEILVWLD